MQSRSIFDILKEVDLGLLFADPWVMFKSMGIVGMLVLFLGLLVVTCAFVAAGTRKALGMPVALGAARTVYLECAISIALAGRSQGAPRGAWGGPATDLRP